MAQTYTISNEMLTLLQSEIIKTKVNHKNISMESNSRDSIAKIRHDSKKGHNGKVDPIKDENDIKRAKQYFLSQDIRYKNNHTNIRNYMLFVLGLNTGRRVGDILQFRIGDFLMSCNKYNGEYLFKAYIGEKNIKEQKTGKKARIAINSSCKEAITRYLDTIVSFNLTDYLFQSRNGNMLSYNQALRIYKQMANETGLTEKGLNIGTHSARKTLGYQWMKKAENEHNPVALSQLQMFYNHSSPNTTLAYTGITQEEQDNMVKGLCL